jgi:hypothetical protein
VYLPKWLLRAAVRLPTKTFKAARKTIRLARKIGAQVVREKQDLAQQGLDINGDVFGTLREKIFPPFPLNNAGLMMTLNCSVDPVHSDGMRGRLTGQELVTQTQTIMAAGQQHPIAIPDILLLFCLQVKKLR